eukprot:m.10081 g.10081  ORF g.10081 m.10081 type:complete len:289 (+) comp6505_c0_seq4:188-1054(+)
MDIVKNIVKNFQKSRCSTYPGGLARFTVPDALISWKSKFDEYSPVFYEAPVVLKQPEWADVPENRSTFKYNEIDGTIDRTSAHSPYVVTQDGYPRNPLGRTGICGRGLLGRYGPNHAADPVVTMWKRDTNGKIVMDTDGYPVLVFVSIKRRDSGVWALPGGMVDAGEVASQALKREFGEEALNAMALSKEETEALENELTALFDTQGATVLYKGFVDDPRNTDNAWMETTVVNIHDDDSDVFSKFKLEGGDDATNAEWVEYHPGMELYASHTYFMELAYNYQLKRLQQ